MRRWIVTYYLRSGDRVWFRANDVTHTKQANQLVGLNVTNGNMRRPEYTRLDAVDAIVSRPTIWGWCVIVINTLFSTVK